MTAAVVFLPSLDVATARQIIAQPDLHDDAAVLDACELLMRRGDWMDHERARLLHRAIWRAGVDELQREALRPERNRRLLQRATLGLLLLLLLFTLT